MVKCRVSGTVALIPMPSNSPEELPTGQGRRLLTIREVLQDLLPSLSKIIALDVLSLPSRSDWQEEEEKFPSGNLGPGWAST